MPRPDAAQLVAKHLPDLQHPDGTILRGMGFSSFLVQATGDQKAVDNINALALAHGEAIIHTLESNGFTLTHSGDPKPIDAAGVKIASIRCSSASCMVSFFEAPLDAELNVSVPGRAFITAIAQRSRECPHA